jgi:hypothetical protein
MSMNPLNDISSVYMQEVLKPQLGKKEGGGAPADGAQKVKKGENTQEASAKRIRQAVYDIRYRARREEVPIQQAFNQYSGKSNMTGPEKAAVKEKLGLTAGAATSESVEYVEEADDKKYMVRVTDKTSGKTYRRYATREKIAQLRANPNISSVEMTQYGTPYEGEKKKGEQTAKTKSGKGLDPVGSEDKDIDNDGDHDKTDKYLLNRRKKIGQAIEKKGVKEGFSNWRCDLSEVMDDIEANKQIKEKKVKNKIKINPEIKESIEEIGGTLLEMVEIDEVDFIVESVYDELLEEGYAEDDIEEAIEYALTEASVTYGHDTDKSPEKKTGAGRLAKAVGRLARQKLSSKVRGAKKAAKAAVATGARKVAKKALGVARKIEGGDNKPSAAHTKSRSASTYRGAGAGTKEKVSSGSYNAPSTTKKKAEKPADPWEGSATTPKTKKTAAPKTKKTAAPKTKTKAATKKKKSNLDDLLSSIRNEEFQLDEKALSRAQQRFMGMVYAAKQGETPASPEVAKAAAGISKKAARDFAKTKHTKLPEKKVEEAVTQMPGRETTPPAGTTAKQDDIQRKQMLANKQKMMQKQMMLQRQQLQLQKQGKLPMGHAAEEVEFEIEEGMSMKDFKANRRKLKRREASADAKKRGHVGKEWYNSGRTYSPDEAKRSRAKIDDEERSTRKRSAIDPDAEDSDYSADKTKNPKKIRKQAAMGEDFVSELNRYEKEIGKDYKTGKEVKSGGSTDKAFTTVKKMMRSQTGKPAGQRKKEPGKKPPVAGSYGAPQSPAQKIAKRRADAKRAQDNMSSRFD